MVSWLKKMRTDVLVIGAGNIGISVAFYLKRMDPKIDVTLIDCGQPMAFTSAQSGENYRNWWPHPVMRTFMDHSIDLMEQIAVETDNILQMNRRGYILATRSSNPDGLLAELQDCYRKEEIRSHLASSGHSYEPAFSDDWKAAPAGVDILSGRAQISGHFPYLDTTVQHIVHIRRGGTISGQQLGGYMLAEFRSCGGHRLQGKVTAIDKEQSYRAVIDGGGSSIEATRIVNAAGPFLSDIAEMVELTLPVQNWLQQKIAFEDYKGVVPRTMPFAIDLDAQCLDWSEEERALIQLEPDFAWLANELAGGIHCRPEGGDHGTWVKMGWAFNQKEVLPSFEPEFDDQFPEIVLRGAARLQPGLKAYYGHLPRATVHYGGYYTLTDENWPLLGRSDVEGFYIAGALSGFGTMAACAAGELVASTVLDRDLPNYAAWLSPRRYADPAFKALQPTLVNRGIL